MVVTNYNGLKLKEDYNQVFENLKNRQEKSDFPMDEQKF